MHARQPVLLFSAMMLALTPMMSAQTAYPRPPGSNTTPAATTPADTTTPAATTSTAPATQTTTMPVPKPDATGDVPPPAKVAPGKTAAKVVPKQDAAKDQAAAKAADKKAKDDEKAEEKAKKAEEAKAKKAPYSGPTEIVVAEPTAMLDENGKQALDPDGKPLFNAAQKQQRDKKGHPMFDAEGKPVFQTTSDLGYDDHGKKIKAAKVKPPKLVPVHITRGTFTVDGLTGKAALNYDIPDLKYMYFFVPGTGIVIVSNTTFPGAKEYPKAFVDKQLDLMVGDHKLELSSDTMLLSKKPESAFVKIDRDYNLPAKFPVVGYGKLRVQPYAWPGSKQNTALAGVIAPPPLPKNLQPVLAIPACPKGQSRMPAPPAEVGKTPQVMPCMTPAQIEAAKHPTDTDHKNYGR